MDIILNETRLKVYRNGDIYRWMYNKKNGVWFKNIKNTPNTTQGYNSIHCKGKMYLRHRIMGYCYLGLDIEDPIIKIDHIDRIKLHNHINNLQLSTQQRNCFNREAKGYYWDKQRNKWKAQICLNYKVKHLGYYDNEDDAHNAYLDGKEKYHNYYE